MRLFLGACLASLFIAVGAQAGGGDWNDQQQEQYAVPQTKVVAVPDKGDDNNALIWVAVVGAVGTLGAAFITTRNRKG